MENFAVKAVSVNGVVIDYVIFGTGKRNLVILPGVSLLPITLSAPAIAGAYGKRFAADYTVIVLSEDLPAPGGTVDDLAMNVAAALDEIGVTQADVFGVSLGGMVAQRLAIRYPDKVRRLILGSTVARQNAMTAEVFDRFEALAKAGDIAALNHYFWERVYSPQTLAQFGDSLKAVENEGSASDLERFLRLTAAARTFDTYDDLEKITCPVLVLGAGEDRAVSAEASVEIARKLNCESYIYPGYGHAVYDEAPDYKERLYAFLMA